MDILYIKTTNPEVAGKQGHTYSIFDSKAMFVQQLTLKTREELATLP